jgi:hypothetical protein
MIMNNEQARIWKKAVVGNLKAIPSFGNHEKTKSG